MRGADSYIDNMKSLKLTDFNIHSIQTSIDTLVLTAIKPDLHLLHSLLSHLITIPLRIIVSLGTNTDA